MVNKKIKMNEKNADGTFNVLHPETTTEQVINPITGQSINEHFSDVTKKHIEIVDEIPSNLAGKGVFFEKQGSISNAPNKPTIQEMNDKLDAIASITSTAGNLAIAIANTPDGGRLLLKNAGIYTISSSITVSKSIVIDGNNATIISTGNVSLDFNDNVEIYNTTFERVAIGLNGSQKKVKIINNKFNNIYDNAIECWSSLKSLIVKDNEIDGTIVSTGTNKNFNNSGSFVYLNGGKIDFLRIQNNRALNIRGGTSIFMSGDYQDLDISDNTLDTMAQRGIGFWMADYAKGTVSRNRIFKCGVLKAPGLDAEGEGAGVGCNAIYSTGNTNDVEVLDNYIEYVYENGIEGNYRSIKRNTIIGTGMDLVNYPTPSYEGIFFNDGNIDIEDNTLINCLGNGIYSYRDASEDVEFINISIKRNKIVNDVYHEASAICLRSYNSNLTNIYISDNQVENYSTVIELPTEKIYTNVKIGKHIANNYETMLNDFLGAGIDIDEMQVSKVNLIKNGNFNDWNATTNRFTDWELNNATLTLVTDTFKNSARITASDAYNGRIIQTVTGVGYPEMTDNRYSQLVIRAKGNNTLFIRLYMVDAGGAQVVGSYVESVYVTGLSETVFKTFKIKLPYLPSFKLELCNEGSAGSWIEISEANIYLKDFEF